MAKLTLSVDEKIVARAKKLAEQRDTSVSQLVERYLDLVSKPPQPSEATPVLARLRGSLAGVDSKAYREHLERKYR